MPVQATPWGRKVEQLARHVAQDNRLHASVRHQVERRVRVVAEQELLRGDVDVFPRRTVQPRQPHPFDRPVGVVHDARPERDHVRRRLRAGDEDRLERQLRTVERAIVQQIRPERSVVLDVGQHQLAAVQHADAACADQRHPKPRHRRDLRRVRVPAERVATGSDAVAPGCQANRPNDARHALAKRHQQHRLRAVRRDLRLHRRCQHSRHLISPVGTTLASSAPMV